MGVRLSNLIPMGVSVISRSNTMGVSIIYDGCLGNLRDGCLGNLRLGNLAFYDGCLGNLSLADAALGKTTWSAERQCAYNSRPRV